MTAGFGAIVMVSRRRGRIRNVIDFIKKKNIVNGTMHPRVEFLLQSNWPDRGLSAGNLKENKANKDNRIWCDCDGKQEKGARSEYVVIFIKHC